MAPDRDRDVAAIRSLNDDFARHLDQNDLDGFLALFTDDVAYANGARHLSGAAGMRAFFTARAGGGRISRHLYSGLRAGFTGADTAGATSVWLTFAGSGALPIRPADPFAVADVADLYRRGADGVWHIAARTITPVFLSESVPKLPARAS